MSSHTDGSGLLVASSRCDETSWSSPRQPREWEKNRAEQRREETGWKWNAVGVVQVPTRQRPKVSKLAPKQHNAQAEFTQCGKAPRIGLPT